MGLEIDKTDFTASDFENFGMRLRDNLKALEMVLATSPDACSASSSVSVTSSAFIVVHSFQAMMKRAKSSSTVER